MTRLVSLNTWSHFHPGWVWRTSRASRLTQWLSNPCKSQQLPNFLAFSRFRRYMCRVDQHLILLINSSHLWWRKSLQWVHIPQRTWLFFIPLEPLGGWFRPNTTRHHQNCTWNIHLPQASFVCFSWVMVSPARFSSQSQMKVWEVGNPHP